MFSLADLCPPSSILLDVPAQTPHSLFEQAACFAERHFGLPAAQVLQKLLDRERIGPTGLGRGIAIPHARVEGLERPALIFIRPVLPVDGETPDGKGLSEFFFLLMPAKATQHHLQALADLAAALHQRDFRQALRAAHTQTAIHRLLATAPLHLNAHTRSLTELES
ncbi:PTS sugar transporter subunit IIA [Silvimonas sp.]|uniref:PTS sugar transporter subunit IIA n=1 Tax=Silvimonas sp. TaxID=2650811 RepID=UPI002840C4D8|nr:PTS sugar transporter subunit IIA [Silvimonas sp.]MDR3426278.1 PTS sugar transporter subunit IIA [Silvimonas sp.]